MTLWDPMDCSLPGSSVHGDSWGKNTGVGYHALLQEDLPNPGKIPGIEPRSPVLQADSLPSEPPEKPPGIHCICTKATEESPGRVQSILKEREHTGKFWVRLLSVLTSESCNILQTRETKLNIKEAISENWKTNPNQWTLTVTLIGGITILKRIISND